MSRTPFKLVLSLCLAAGCMPALAARLVIWMVGDDKTPRVMQPAVEAYRALHPGVAIEVRDVPWADAMTKYSAALASRRGPDLITGSTSYAIALGAKGALVDLNQAAPDLVRELALHANPGALRAIRRPDGTLHGAPFDMHVQLQYYRSDLLRAAPTDWDGFLAAARALLAQGHGFAQQWGNTSWLGFYPYLRQAGGAVYDDSCTRAVVDSPAAVRALAYYAALYRELKAPTDGWPDADGGLESGAYALMQSGTWLLSRMDMTHKGLVGRWAAAPLPTGPTGRRTAILGGTVVSLLAASLVAFVLTKRPFPGSRWLFRALLLSMMLPWEVTIVPNFVTVVQLGWINSYAALMVPGLAKAFVVFYFRQAMQAVPDELVSAATLEGAGTLPLPLQLGKMAGDLSFKPQAAAVLTAGSLLASLPAIVLFLAFQRQVVAGLQAGATKG